MLIGSTPTFTMRLPEGTDLSGVEHFVFSIEQDGVFIHKEDEDIELRSDNRTVDIYLDQEDTLQLNFHKHSDEKTKADIQLNFYWPNGQRGGTKVKEIELEENLYMSIMS